MHCLASPSVASVDTRKPLRLVHTLLRQWADDSGRTSKPHTATMRRITESLRAPPGASPELRVAMAVGGLLRDRVTHPFGGSMILDRMVNVVAYRLAVSGDRAALAAMPDSPAAWVALLDAEATAAGAMAATVVYYAEATLIDYSHDSHASVGERCWLGVRLTAHTATECAARDALAFRVMLFKRHTCMECDVMDLRSNHINL